MWWTQFTLTDQNNIYSGRLRSIEWDNVLGAHWTPKREQMSRKLMRTIHICVSDTQQTVVARADLSQWTKHDHLHLHTLYPVVVATQIPHSLSRDSTGLSLLFICIFWLKIKLWIKAGVLGRWRTRSSWWCLSLLSWFKKQFIWGSIEENGFPSSVGDRRV